MHKHPPKLEWRFSESDAEWATQQALLLPEVTAAVSHRRRLKQYVGLVMTTLLLFTGVGGWWRYSTQANLRAAQAELRAAVAQKSLAVVTPERDALVASSKRSYSGTDSGYQHEQAVNSLQVAVQSVSSATNLTVALQTIEIQASQAVVQVVLRTRNGTPMYRETRFYQYTNLLGWWQTLPVATLWGAERSLVTPYFIYHFGANDEATILAVAPQMDALYTTLWRNFGLPIDPSPAKLVIDVRVTQRPGQATVFDAANHISVASPAVYLAPVELTDADLLAQSIALPLLNAVVAQAGKHHALDSTWQPMLRGLRLWQVWELDLPLAAWRQDIVQWLYIDGTAVGLGQSFVLPTRYAALCTAHKLWLLSPLEIDIPLLCGRPEWEEQSIPLWQLRDPLIGLDQLGVPRRPGEWIEEPDSLHQPHPLFQTVALATLFEYAVATYGRDRLPILVAGLDHYDRWATLIPAVYGVSAVEFEAGWQVYLTTHYGVAKEHS